MGFVWCRSLPAVIIIDTRAGRQVHFCDQPCAKRCMIWCVMVWVYGTGLAGGLWFYFICIAFIIFYCCSLCL